MEIQECDGSRSGTQGGADLRWLFIDLNSYFASVERRLVVKCGARLRRMALLDGGLALFVDLEEDRRRYQFNASLERRFVATHDTFVPLRNLEAMWRAN